MSKIALVYGTSTGNTERVAVMIQNRLADHHVELYNVQECGVDFYGRYDNFIFGVSTWGEGDLQDDWECYVEAFRTIDFTGKTVAIFGLGDQEEYPDNYVDAMGTLYDILVENGAHIVGSWHTVGYDFDESAAVRDGEFVGLALDEDNQSDQTDKRIETWLGEVLPAFV